MTTYKWPFILLFLIAFFLGFFVIRPLIKQDYILLPPDDVLHGKTFVMVWTPQSLGHSGVKHSYFGFGDVLRGTVTMFQLCKKLKMHYYVDISLHPIAKYLEYKSDHPYKHLMPKSSKDVDFLGIYPMEVKRKFFTSYMKADIVFGFSNLATDEYMKQNVPLEDDVRQFMLQILQPKPILKKTIATHARGIPDSFIALHYRLGDNALIKNGKIDEKQVMKHVKKQMDKRMVLFTDSSRLKKLVYETMYDDLSMFHFDIGHLGWHADDTKVFNSLVEFFVLTQAKEIRTTSVYSWISNFILAVHKIYRVPIRFEKEATYLVKGDIG